MYFPWCKLESCPTNACLAVSSSRLTPVPGGSLTAVQYRVPRTPRLIYLLQSPLKYVLCSPMIVHVPSSTRHQPSLSVARTYSLRVNRHPLRGPATSFPLCREETQSLPNLPRGKRVAHGAVLTVLPGSKEEAKSLKKQLDISASFPLLEANANLPCLYKSSNLATKIIPTVRTIQTRLLWTT